MGVAATQVPRWRGNVRGRYAGAKVLKSTKKLAHLTSDTLFLCTVQKFYEGGKLSTRSKFGTTKVWCDIFDIHNWENR